MLDDKSHFEFVRHLPHRFLGRLHEEWHGRVLLADKTTKLNTCIQLLGTRGFAFVAHEADIGYHAYHIRAEPAVQLHGFVIAGSHEHFRSCALTEQLLFLVERIADSHRILLQDQFVEQRKVSGIVANGVLDEQNSPHTLLEDVVLGI